MEKNRIKKNGKNSELLIINELIINELVIISLFREIEKISTKNESTPEVLKVTKINHDGTFDLKDEYEENVTYYEVKKVVNIDINEKDDVIVIFINDNPNNPVIIGSYDLKE